MVKMLLFVQMISSKLTNSCYQTEYCQNVMQNGWFAIFKVKATARVHMIMTVSTTSSELLMLLLPNLV